MMFSYDLFFMVSQAMCDSFVPCYHFLTVWIISNTTMDFSIKKIRMACIFQEDQ